MCSLKQKIGPYIYMALVSKFRDLFCSAFVVVMAASIFTVAAQTRDDLRDAKIAAAIKELQDAANSGNAGDAAAKLASIEKLKGVEKVFEELNDEENLAAAYSIHGMYLFLVGQLDPGLELLNKSLAIFNKRNSPAGVASTLLGIATIQLKKGDKDKAIETLNEASIWALKEPMPPVDLQILFSLGNLYVSKRDYKKSYDTYWKAYDIAKTRTNEDAIVALKNIANAYLQLDMARLAPPIFEIALTRARQEKSAAREADILDALGSAYLYHLNQPEKALGYFADAIKVAEPLDLPLLKAEVLDGLGQCAYRMMDIPKALDFYTKALAFTDKFPNSSGRKGNILFNMAQIQLLLGDAGKAAETLESAKTLAQTSGEQMLLSATLGSLADIAERNRDYAKAIQLSNEAGKIILNNPNSYKARVDWLNGFALLCMRGGLRKEPDETLQKALVIAKSIEYRFGEASVLESQGILAFVNDDRQKAIELYGQALIIFRSLGIKAREARVLENLMSAWSKSGNPGVAVFFGKSAVNIYQGFQKNAAGFSPDQQKAFLDNFATAYRSLSKVLIEQGRIAEAEQVLTMLKQEELMEYVRRDDGIAKQMLATMTISDEERAAIVRYDTLAGQITAVGKEFADLEEERKQFAVGEFPKQEEYDKLKQELADATLTFQKFLDELKLKFGQQDARVVEIDSGLKKTLDRLKATRTAAVSTIVGEDTLNIIVTTSKTQRAHSVKIAAKDINELVAKFRTALTSPQYDPRPVGQQLYDLIVKPIEGDLAGINADTILWSLDGTLRYIPPAALWDKKNGYMAERFANVMVNLASRDNLLFPKDKGQQLSVLGVGVSKPTDGFSALTAVPDELDCIVADKSAGLFSAKPQCTSGVLSGRKLLDESFTLTNFEGELGRYPIVHIASHFKLTPGDDKNSFLLLGGGADRKFTVEKLRTEPLTDIDLIVLSACNTATPGGARTNGVEVEGFGSIAQKEGAKAVLATLWSVADTSTKDFMVEFYRLYGKEGKSKADAMRQAQLKLMYGKYSAGEAQKHRADDFVTATDQSLPKFTPDPNAPFAHPFYWSPFTLIGNWQ
jgi:CHAT domain-containing protein/tetratricopeptide (TPR) repeat protein